MPATRHSHPEARRFSRRLWLALVLLTGAATAVAVGLARWQLLASETEAVRVRFATESGARRALRDWRIDRLQDQVRNLATRPRLHAALEDDALDLLPEVARDELREITALRPSPGVAPAAFYRFLDPGRHLLPGPADDSAGTLPPGLASDLPAYAALDRPGWGPWIAAGPDATAWELVAAPFRSTANGRRLGTLVVGFPLTTPTNGGLWSGERLHAPALEPALQEALAQHLASLPPPTSASSAVVTLAGEPYLLALERLAPDETFTASWEIDLASLAPLRERQRRLTWRIVLVGGAIAALLAVAAGWLSARFAAWFARVARGLEAQRLRRQLAERRLTRTTAERDRAARFAADASHQLKTPVTVLRLGLDELAATPAFPPELQPEVHELTAQTDRLGHIIDDLLLLARLDAGLVPTGDHATILDDLIDRAIDDASISPGSDRREFIRHGATSARVQGDPRHLILIAQNLYENAVKYGVDGSPIHTTVAPAGDFWLVHISGASALPIAPTAAETIFERFHRGASAGGKPGYGLGLNLARQLARLHGGDLRLLASDVHLTTFELRLRMAA